MSGIGIKWATEYLQQFGTLEEMLKRAEEVTHSCRKICLEVHLALLGTGISSSGASLGFLRELEYLFDGHSWVSSSSTAFYPVVFQVP